MDLIETAERAVLAAVFRAHARLFVWIGGSVLRLLYESPRASFDLDLAAQEEPPPAKDLAVLAAQALRHVNLTLGSRCTVEPGAVAHRLEVSDAGRRLFLVDCTRISGRIVDTAPIIIQSVVGPEAVVVPSGPSLLALKIESLLFRRFLKPTDVFDICFLRSLNVKLQRQHCDHLTEQVRVRELEWRTAGRRLRELTPERFLRDLRKRLSPEVYHAWTPARASAALRETRALLKTEILWP
jgi:hypothetical protein